MKSLLDFKNIVEEEKSDYSKFDVLVRAGLGNKAQIQRMHRILEKMGEERPVFSNADRMIMQNLFTKMVDLITNNKQIFQQTRKAVREQVEEGTIVTSDFKLGPSGKKVKAHRMSMGTTSDNADTNDNNNAVNEYTLPEMPEDPPFVLVLKRKAVRLYPNKTKVALYYNQKLDKYFTIPYGEHMAQNPLQSEEVELHEAVMDQLHKIVGEKSAKKVKFANGQTRTVDHFTASAITQVHKHLNDQDKKKFSDLVHRSPAHLSKATDFAFRQVK